MPATLSFDVLRRLWPHGDQHVPGLMEGIVASAPAVFEKYAINTPLTVALMFGQFSEECGAGLEMVENLNYSEQGLLNTFPSHFTGSMAARYTHNPRMIADVAYGGRMGNAPPPSDDGWNYRGRGLSQCTGKEGYEKLAAKCGLDVVGNPDLLSEPRNRSRVRGGRFRPLRLPALRGGRQYPPDDQATQRWHQRARRARALDRPVAGRPRGVSRQAGRRITT